VIVTQDQDMKKNQPILIILVLTFLLGLLGFTNRGESWDEFLLHRYAVRSLNAYQTWALEGNVKITLDDLGGYGPAFVMLDELIFRFLQRLLPIHYTDIYHLINFIVFLVGVWAFYDIGIHWLTRTGAVGATLLLLTQPVVWGHAFMNSKDIPFLAFFLLSLALGFRMIDSLKLITLSVQTDGMKDRLTLLTATWLVSVFGLFTLTGTVHSFITDLVQSAAAGHTNIISLVASDILSVPPEVYIQKIFLLFLRVRLIYLLALTSLLVYFLVRHSQPTLSVVLPILLPAVVLGFTVSIRILGPFAGLIVVYYGLRTKGKSALASLGLYAVIAVMAMYFFWPYLWENPIGHLLESVKLMSSYPWNSLVLFNGQKYISTELPYYYLPMLLGIQLTELVLLLFLVGFAILIVDVQSKSKNESNGKQVLFELVLLWFVVPVLSFIILRPSLYDNFRQVFFILPPIFLVAGIVFSRIKKPVWQITLITLATLPGVLGGIHLHPYEYIYYNRFIGGVNGAQGRFELDYWVTSYREATEYVNSVANPNSYVWVEGPAHVFGAYARADLKVLDAYDPALLGKDYYIVAPARHGLDQVITPEIEIIYTVSRDGAPLAVIKKP